MRRLRTAREPWGTPSNDCGYERQSRLEDTSNESTTPTVGLATRARRDSRALLPTHDRVRRHAARVPDATGSRGSRKRERVPLAYGVAEGEEMTHKWLRVALFVHVFLFALVVGVFWGTWFSLSRSIDAITAPTFLEVGHTMIANLGGPMAVLMPTTLLSAAPVLFVLYRLHRRASFSLMLVGVGLLVVALVITLSVNV